MKLSFSKSQKIPFFSQNFKSAFKTRLQELRGILLLVISASMFISLLSYDAYDPSWNVAIQANDQNILGSYGAITADLLHQTFGFMSYVFVIIFGIWGCYGVVNRSIGWLSLRLLILIIMVSMINFLICQILTEASIGFIGQILSIRYGVKLQTVLTTQGINIALVILLIMLTFVCGIRWQDIKQTFKWATSIRPSLFDIFKISSFHSKVNHNNFVQKDKQTNPISCIKSWFTFSHKNSEKRTVQEPIFYTPASESLRAPIPSNSMDKISLSKAPSLQTFDIERNSLADAHTDKPIKTTSSPNARKADKKNDVQKNTILDLDIHTTYQLPPLELLKQAQNISGLCEESDRQLQEQAVQLMAILEEFGIKGQIVKVRPGPVVTLYELVPAAGIKTSRVVGLSDDIARSMCALSARIAVVPGQNALGIELPNKNRQMVFLRELMVNNYFDNQSVKLALALGKDISGMPVITDLARMPHLLVAGTTGSGKSVAINTMILSLLYRLSPEKCRFIMIDPKMLELSVYDGIPHLLTPVVTEPKKAIYALKWTVREMEDRYRSMSRLGVRNVEGFNARLQDARQKGEILTRQVQTGFDSETGQPLFETQPLALEDLPYIVVVVDEMADLMMVAGKEIELAVQRLAQMARAAGIHLIMATQRPSVDVITGTIKANFPTRISFQVTSRFDSRTILGEQGAEQLLGRGDMLFMEPGGKIQRIHGPFVGDDEVEKVVNYLKSQGVPNYLDTITEDTSDTPLDTFETGQESKGDRQSQLYRQAIALIQREGKVSTSFIQRHLQIGYNSAARIIEQMENEGLISAANHVGKREILSRV